MQSVTDGINKSDNELLSLMRSWCYSLCACMCVCVCVCARVHLREEQTEGIKAKS